jgi:hypothetical protein
MKTLLKTVVTFSVLLAIVLGAYYGYRRSAAKKAGEEYPFSRAPGDLVREIAGIFDREKEPESPAPEGPDAPAPAVEPPPSSAPKPDPHRFEEARELYEAGEYRQAIPLLTAEIAEPGASAERPREMLARSNLFLLLLEGAARDSDLDGDPVALLTTASGETMFVTVSDETPTDIAFRKEGGISARLPKKSLKALEVARSPDKKTYLYEQRYRSRVESARTQAELLELARECWRTGLAHHVTFLLERALEAPGDDLERIVAGSHADAERASATDRAAFVRGLLVHFFPNGEYSRRTLAGTSGPGVVVEGPEPLRPGGNQPASGIGGSSVRTPRGTDPALNDLLEKADRYRETANEHYRQAQPGSPDIAEHRDKAIDAYRKALELYEQVSEKWDVNLERTFREIQTRLYQMLKDKPVR